MTDETRQSPMQTVSHDGMTTAAREAVRIADAFLPREPMKRRKALALEIVNAVNLCEAEFAAEINRLLGQLNTSQRPEDT